MVTPVAIETVRNGHRLIDIVLVAGPSGREMPVPRLLPNWAQTSALVTPEPTT